MVDLIAVDNAIISQCKLFGCGVVGVRANDSTLIQVLESEIYDCSYYAATFSSCKNVVFNNCRIYDNAAIGPLFLFNTSENCAVTNCEIRDNSSPALLVSSYSSKVSFTGNIVENNSLAAGLFYFSGQSVTVEGCSFTGNQGSWYASDYPGMQEESLPAIDSQGNELSDSDLQSMEHMAVEGWQPETTETPSLSAAEDGSIHVSTVDEFLAAIAPNTSIYLEDGVYDLSTASNYGGYGNEYYMWKDTMVDGPQLVICNLRGLSITGGGLDKVSIIAQPRYAEVLAFDNCQDIKLSGFTAGHAQEPGTCVGGVLYFNETDNVEVAECSLYGCGVWGVTAISCKDLAVSYTEIYDCSNGDINLRDCNNVSFEKCDIHHNGLTRIVDNCQDALIDGEPLRSYYPPNAFELRSVFVTDAGTPLPEDLHIYSDVMAVKEISLPAYIPIELKAAVMVTGQGATNVEDVTWTVSDESKLSLEERKHGSCVVENLGSQSGSVTVTAEYQGQTAQLKINFVQELYDPASSST